MILPNVRASFGRDEAGVVLGLLTRGDTAARERLDDRLRDDGFDAILDDPRTLNVVLTEVGPDAAPPRLTFYLLVRHALLEVGVTDRTIADYLAALLIEFGQRDRAYRIAPDDTRRYLYLVDIIEALDSADGRRAFLLRAHLGNYALWLSGLFPDHVEARVERRGAPGLGYYEEMGATGYRTAASSRVAGDHGLDDLLRQCADAFPDLRVALNRLSDRYMFPARGGSVARLLRQVGDAFELRERHRD